MKVLGQILRLVGPATRPRLAWCRANTGGANVSPLRRIAIAPELQQLIDAAHGAAASRAFD
jgi:hypothetical protein